MSKKKEVTETKAAVTVKTPSVLKSIKNTEPTIYVGPNVPGGGLSRFMTFRSGILSAHVGKIVQNYPSINRLVVPVSRLSAVLNKLNDPESAEATHYAAALAEIKKGE